MLKYINQLPSQETFQPPPLPFVSLSVDENDVKYHDLTIQKNYIIPNNLPLYIIKNYLPLASNMFFWVGREWPVRAVRKAILVLYVFTVP